MRRDELFPSPENHHVWVWLFFYFFQLPEVTQIFWGKMCYHGFLEWKRGWDDKWQKFSLNLKMAAGLNMEEISGTIQNSLADVGKDESTSRIKQWINKRRSQLKPWTEFMNAKAFSRPKDVAQASRRIVKNLDAYQTNYIAICLFLAIYCM